MVCPNFDAPDFHATAHAAELRIVYGNYKDPQVVRSLIARHNFQFGPCKVDFDALVSSSMSVPFSEQELLVSQIVPEDMSEEWCPCWPSMPTILPFKVQPFVPMVLSSPILPPLPNESEQLETPLGSSCESPRKLTKKARKAAPFAWPSPPNLPRRKYFEHRKDEKFKCLAAVQPRTKPLVVFKSELMDNA